MAGTGHYEFSGTVNLGIWVRRSGAWQRVTGVSAYGYQYGVPGQQTVAWSFVGGVQLGVGIEAFGVTIDSFDGNGAALSNISRIEWNGTGAGSGQRTALPNGSTTTVTVRPK